MASLAIGLWLYIENNEFAVLSDGRNLVGSVFLIAVGFGVIIVGFLGIAAAILESTVMASVVSYRVHQCSPQHAAWSLIPCFQRFM